jgi:hypothetical protein
LPLFALKLEESRIRVEVDLMDGDRTFERTRHQRRGQAGDAYEAQNPNPNYVEFGRLVKAGVPFYTDGVGREYIFAKDSDPLQLPAETLKGSSGDVVFIRRRRTSKDVSMPDVGDRIVLSNGTSYQVVEAWVHLKHATGWLVVN